MKNEHPRLYETFSSRRATAFEAQDAALRLYESVLDYAQFEHRQVESDRLALVDEIVQEIKACAGFENFLLPVATTRIQSLAGEGAIVVLNPSRYRTDAILVTKSRTQSIELSNSSEQPKFFQTLSNMSNILAPGPRESRDMTQINEKTIAVLYALWQRVVKPICEALDFTDERMRAKLNETPPNINACRIRWLTSGVFSRLPLHAAGIWVGRCTDVLVKLAISSYAASFRVLDYASERSKGIESAELRGHIASMERPIADVPYWKKKMSLKSAQRESQWIQRANNKIEWKELVRPSVQEIFKMLLNYPFAHFATHGISDARDPMNSHLVLMTPIESEEPLALSSVSDDRVVRDNLTVSDIFRCTDSNAALVFLAACSTADVSNVSLADESIHIANAF